MKENPQIIKEIRGREAGIPNEGFKKGKLTSRRQSFTWAGREKT